MGQKATLLPIDLLPQCRVITLQNLLNCLKQCPSATRKYHHIICVTTGQRLGTLKEVNHFRVTKALRDLDNVSAPMTNKADEMGSPYRKLCKDLKKPCGTPLIITENPILEIRRQIMPIQVSLKPKRWSTCRRKNQDTLSYAFIISNLITTLLPRFNFLISVNSS